MIRRPARSTRTDALFPYTTLFRSADPVAEAWEQIRGGLRRDCGARAFDGWLRPIALGGFDPACGTVRFELPSQFMADSVQRSEEHTSELQSLMRISYAVFCLKKKKTTTCISHVSKPE